MIETPEKPYYAGLGERVDWDDIQVAGRGKTIQTHQLEFDAPIDVSGQSIVNRAEEKYSPIVVPLQEPLTLGQMYYIVGSLASAGQPYEIQLKAGTYDLPTGGCKAYPHVTLRGAGIGVTIVRITGTGQNLFNCNSGASSGWYQFENLTLAICSDGGTIFEWSEIANLSISCRNVHLQAGDSSVSPGGGFAAKVFGGTGAGVPWLEFIDCVFSAYNIGDTLYLVDTADSFDGDIYFKNCYFEGGLIRGTFADATSTILIDGCYTDQTNDMSLGLIANGAVLKINSSYLYSNNTTVANLWVLEVQNSTVTITNSILSNASTNAGSGAMRTNHASAVLNSYNSSYFSAGAGVTSVLAGGNLTLIGGRVSTTGGGNDLINTLGTISVAYVRYTTSSGTITNLITLSTTNFGPTTSAQLAAVISDETGAGLVVFNNAPTFIAPVLGSPASGNLLNCTGFPLSQLTGAGSGVLTFLAAPSSINLLNAVTDETGTGLLVFATNPVLTTPNIGTPSAGVLTNCTGLPVAGGGTGLSSWTANGILYASGTTTLANSANLTYDGSDLQMLGTTAGSRLYVDNADMSVGIRNTRNFASWDGAWLTFEKARGTLIVGNGDALGTIVFRGYDGTNYDDGASIVAEVDGTPGAGTDMPTRLSFRTSADGSATPTERMRISSAGVVTIPNLATAGIVTNTAAGVLGTVSATTGAWTQKTDHTFTGFSADPTYISIWARIGNIIIWSFTTTATGTSNGTGFTISLPVTARTLAGATWKMIAWQGTDNGAYQNNVLAQISSGGTTVTLQPQGGSVNWTNSGAKGATGMIIYEAA